MICLKKNLTIISGKTIPLITVLLSMTISMKNSELTFSPSELAQLAQLAKRDELRANVHTSTCVLYGSPLKVKPDWAN